MKKFKIFAGAVLALALSAGFVACSEDELADDKNQSQIVNVGGLKIQVGDYPAASSELRSVAGFSAGKTAWKKGDKIQVLVTFKNTLTGETYKTQEVTLQRSETEWSPITETFATSASNIAVNISAYYSQNNEVYVEKVDGMYSPTCSGTEEYFQFDAEGLSASEPIVINFERIYSRLRVYTGGGIPEVTLTSEVGVDADGVPQETHRFKATGRNFVTSAITVNTENSLNAMFYGSWGSESVFTINGRKYKMNEWSNDGSCYVIDLTAKEAVYVSDDWADMEKGFLNIKKSGDPNYAKVKDALEASHEVTKGDNKFILAIKAEDDYWTNEDNPLKDILAYVQEYFENSGKADLDDENFSFVLNLYEVQNISKIDFCLTNAYATKIILPRNIETLGAGVIINTSEYLQELYIPNSLESWSTGRGKKTFQAVSDVTLFLEAEKDGLGSGFGDEKVVDSNFDGEGNDGFGIYFNYGDGRETKW